MRDLKKGAPIKIVCPDTLQKQLLYSYRQGFSFERYVEAAGHEIALFIYAQLKASPSTLEITFFIGKGEKGAIGLAASLSLIQLGITPQIVLLHKVELQNRAHQEMISQMEKSQRVVDFESLSAPSHSQPDRIIFDAICDGIIDDEESPFLNRVTTWIHQSALPVFSIDGPSGVCLKTGEAKNGAVFASYTLYLTFPKIGLFLRDGWNHAGKLIPIPLTLPEVVTKDLEALSVLHNNECLQLPFIKRTRHKYESGYVVGITGSKNMPGAAFLFSLAALKSGAGITRNFHMSSTPSHGYAPEVLFEEFSMNRFLEEAKRASSLVIGCGIDAHVPQSHEILEILTYTIDTLQKPVVLDAGAFASLSRKADWKPKCPCILTPHWGEMKQLLNGREVSLQSCQAFVDERGVSLVLKGSPTILFHPREVPLMMPYGDAGMATAGCGDVLAGILGSLLAQGMGVKEALELAVYLHAKSGEMAAEALTSYCLMASDLITYLPQAYLLLKKRSFEY